MIVAGTGSRSLQTADNSHKQAVLDTTIEHLTTLSPEFVVSGMAEGFDHCIAVAALHLSIPLIAAIPTRSYGDYYWGRKSLTGTNQMERFNYLLTQAAEIVYVCDQLYVNGVHANFVRNDWMVAKADHFLVYNPSSRGTAQCLASIKRVEKPFDIVA